MNSNCRIVEDNIFSSMRHIRWLFGQHVSGLLSLNSICIESTFQRNGSLIVLMANKSVKKL